MQVQFFFPCDEYNFKEQDKDYAEKGGIDEAVAFIEHISS